MVAFLVRSLRDGLRRPRRWAGLGLCLTLSACGGAHDSASGLTKEDYEALKARRPAVEQTAMPEPPIPDLAPVLAAPQPPLLADNRRVSVRATDATPVKDLLIEIARQADIDLELDPRIEGGVIITARDRPLADVIERIADLANLRYKLADNRLRVELDDPYLHSYRLDVLALTRDTTTTISSSTDVFSAVGEGAAGGNNASTTQVASTAKADFWTEITQNITAIIGGPAPAARTSAGATTALQRAAETAQTQAAIAEAQEAAAAEATPGAPGTDAPPSPAEIESRFRAIAGATGAAGASASAATAGAPAEGAATEGPGHYFTVNRQAGILTAFTTERQHEKIQRYLADVRANVGAQVLIEAKIVEVSLDEQFRAGIDWDLAYKGGAPGFSTNFVDGVIGAERTLPTAVLSGATTFGAFSLAGMLQFVDQFGTTRTLSSPRLTVLNNQNAVLKVAENEVYFTIEIEREIDDDTGNETRTYTSEVHTVPIGVILNVQPSINLESEEVSMSLRPTISRIVARRLDPAVELQVAEIQALGGNVNVESPIPVVEVREMDSLVTLQSGDVLVLGGLMQERSENADEGIPIVKDVPVLGAPFKKVNKSTVVTELVIFLRATIVHGRDSISPADRELYNKFTPDPRPIAF